MLQILLTIIKKFSILILQKYKEEENTLLINRAFIILS